MIYRFLVCHCRHRLFEWMMTAAMLMLALEIMLWPGVVEASAFRYIARIVYPDNLALFFLVIGICRIVALFANGNWPVVGPRIRAFAAVGAAIIWGQMLAALIVLAPKTGIPSPGIPVYFAITIGELISAYRAATDVGSRHR